MLNKVNQLAKRQTRSRIQYEKNGKSDVKAKNSQRIYENKKMKALNDSKSIDKCQASVVKSPQFRRYNKKPCSTLRSKIS